MTDALNSTTRTPTSQPPLNSSLSPTYTQRARDGISIGLNTISEWGPVKTVSTSRISLAIGSFFSSIWNYISKLIWRSPSVVKETVKITEPGWLWGENVYELPTETALRKGKSTIGQGIKDGSFTEEDATVNGWISVTFPGSWYGTHTMMLKDAIEGGYLTIEAAMKAGFITESQVDKAVAKGTWLKKLPENK